MIFWIAIAIILAIILIVSYRKAKDSAYILHHEWPAYTIFVCSVLLFIVVLCIICYPIDYHLFLNKYEIQQSQYEALKESGLLETNSNYIIDILNINQELAERQALHSFANGFFSFTPDSIMELTPIGMP